MQVKQISGPTTRGYGLSLRDDALPQQKDPRYDFYIDSNSKWAVVRCDGLGSDGYANCTTLVDFTASDAINGGLHVTNTLEVKAQGSHFDFYANGVKLGSVTDATYASGKIGLVSGENVECVYTNLTVKSLS